MKQRKRIFTTRKKAQLSQQVQSPQPQQAQPSQQAQQPQPQQAQSLFPSLNIGYDLVRERLTYQAERVNTLDNKASFVLGSSTLIIGAAILTRSQIPTCQNSFLSQIF